MKSLFGSTVEYYEFNTKVRPAKKEVAGTATFLKFGLNNDEEGGTFSTAIIKLDDGTLKNIYVEMIRFINE
jgi:hypothetical protein